MEVKDNEIVFSTGKSIYVFCETVGLCLSEDNAITYGHDGTIDWPMPDWWDETQRKEWGANYLTDAEMKELAAYMADAWAALRDRL